MKLYAQLILSACMLSGCSSDGGDKYPLLRIELRMFAEAVDVLLNDEIPKDNIWRGDIKEVVAAIKRDEYCVEKLAEDEVFLTGGKDPWGNEVSVYTIDDDGTRWITVESAGPDGDMDARADNVSVQFPLSHKSPEGVGYH